MRKELDNLARSIIYHTRDWTLFDWKRFRAKNDYWNRRDESVRQKNETEFKQWKLKEIIKHNNINNQQLWQEKEKHQQSDTEGTRV